MALSRAAAIDAVERAYDAAGEAWLDARKVSKNKSNDPELNKLALITANLRGLHADLVDKVLEESAGDAESVKSQLDDSVKYAKKQLGKLKAAKQWLGIMDQVLSLAVKLVGLF